MRWIHQYGPELNERIRNMPELKSLQTAIKMIAGIEAMHMIKKKTNSPRGEVCPKADTSYQ